MKSNTELHQRVHEMLKSSACPKFYSEDAHRLITTEYIQGVCATERSIMLPLPVEDWHEPSVWGDLEAYYEASELTWPQYSHYSYAMDYIHNMPGILYFGYAIEGEKIHPAAFFVTLRMTGVIDGHPEDFYPEEWVIDPFALATGNKPDCYIGTLIPKTEECIMRWLNTGGSLRIHPLEQYALLNKSNRRDDLGYWAAEIKAHTELLSGIPKDKWDDVFKWLSE